MPRVTIKRKEYKLLDLKLWVRRQMVLNHKTQAQVGEVLGLTQPEISYKLKIPDKKKKERVNLDTFTYGQVLDLCEFFEVDEEERKRLLIM